MQAIQSESGGDWKTAQNRRLRSSRAMQKGSSQTRAGPVAGNWVDTRELLGDLNGDYRDTSYFLLLSGLTALAALTNRLRRV